MDDHPVAESGTPDAKLEIGDVIAERYRIEDELGRGGMARVYRVHDLELDEDIALKLLSGDQAWQDEAVDRLKREIRLARRIVHPNVCRIYDFGHWNELHFVTMELIGGETLENRLEGVFLGGMKERLSVFRDVLAGIRAAHQLGIAHLDIKTANVLVTPDKHAVVMDFGIARKIDGSTGDGDRELAGTPDYAAPERLLGEAVDHRSDIYSLGVLLFELSTGHKPFEGSLLTVMQAHLNQPPPRVREHNPQAPEAVDRAVARMLRKDPELRYQSADEILAELAQIRLDGAGRSVLCAVGDEHLRALIAHHLGGVGLTVREADNGEQALESLLRETPDLVLVDVELPRIDGLRIVEMLRRMPHVARAPVYVLSGKRNPAYAAYAKQLEVTRFVERPCASRMLAQELKELLRIT